MSRLLEPTILCFLVLASSMGAVHSQNCFARNVSAVGLTPSAPSCSAFTPSFTASLQPPHYNTANRVSLGVIGFSWTGSYTGVDILVTGKGNNDHVAYGKCCDMCSANPSCTMYSLKINRINNRAADGSRTVLYRCEVWYPGCLTTASPRNSADSVDTYYPAAFARPGPACTDDTPAAQIQSCPGGWSFIEPDDQGEVFPKFEGATADNFLSLGGSAIVKGRLISAPSVAFIRAFPNYTAQQCVNETFKGFDNGEYFTWESCSKTCKIFSGGVCNWMNGQETGFTPSATAFSGRLPPR